MNEIDALAGFYRGKTKRNTGEDGQRFKDFCIQYLPQYDATLLYKDLRSGLVHSYSAGGSLLFVDNRADEHLQKSDGGLLIINLENFLEDIRLGYDKLKEDIRIDKVLLEKVKQRMYSEVIGVMTVKAYTR